MNIQRKYEEVRKRKNAEGKSKKKKCMYYKRKVNNIRLKHEKQKYEMKEKRSKGA